MDIYGRPEHDPEFQVLKASCPNITTEYLYTLWNLVYQSRQQNQYSKPMPWIGIYIALASLLCVVAMVADLLHGLRNRKLWFPCDMDQATKLGSMSFMCTMMANLLPSLATLDDKELVSNMIALAVMPVGWFRYSSNQTALEDQELNVGRLTVEKLYQHVRKYWIMAGTGSPQFMTVCSITTSASGVICAASTGFFISVMIHRYPRVGHQEDYRSDYKWSMVVIFVIQSIGVILGTIAPLARCFSTLSFDMSIKWIWKHLKISIVEESYRTQKLYDWKHSCIPFLSGARKCKIVIQHLKIQSIILCIGFQKIVAIACKMITMITILILICVLCCRACWKWLKAMFSTSCHTLGEQPKEQLGKDEDLRGYVLQIQDDIQFTERTLKRLLKSVNRLIRKAEKQQPKNLMKLLSESRGFEGLAKFDSNHVPSLLSQEYVSCWSLPLVTLTSIAMSLPNIEKNMVDCLLNGVSEGLLYVTLVEESLNATDHDHVSIQKAAETLWVDVEVYHKWLGTKLPNPKSKVNTPGDILKWLRDKAKKKVNKVESMDIRSRSYGSKYMSICANSMYRITETILLNYHDNIEQVSQEELFAHVSSMIADIIAACLTNLPQVILMKCHESVIEKREASVQAAAQLLGETTQIIITLQDRELPRLNPDELAFIDKWSGAYLENSTTTHLHHPSSSPNQHHLPPLLTTNHNHSPPPPTITTHHYPPPPTNTHHVSLPTTHHHPPPPPPTHHSHHPSPTTTTTHTHPPKPPPITTTTTTHNHATSTTHHHHPPPQAPPPPIKTTTRHNQPPLSTNHYHPSPPPTITTHLHHLLPPPATTTPTHHHHPNHPLTPPATTTYPPQPPPATTNHHQPPPATTITTHHHHPTTTTRHHHPPPPPNTHHYPPPIITHHPPPSSSTTHHDHQTNTTYHHYLPPITTHHHQPPPTTYHYPTPITTHHPPPPQPPTYTTRHNHPHPPLTTTTTTHQHHPKTNTNTPTHQHHQKPTPTPPPTTTTCDYIYAYDLHGYDSFLSK
ncbi:unnamed protein product [Lactuca virosa]|uniref:Uncharacterized protein n=1 Tax=Lactuca virosa TaxID=75947 RepID=A0AAU9PPB1_9ASTR|nr:unnamed protein product [Lactuca virosa]